MTAGRVVAALLAVTLLAASGCATWRGARLYESGTRALEVGDVDRALADLQDAARLVPRASEIQNNLGLAWQAAGDLQQARAAFARAVALDCANHTASDNLARIEARLQREERETALRRIAGPQVDPVSTPAPDSKPPRRSP